MQDKDQKLIWEKYNKIEEGTDGSTSDLTEFEKMKLAAAAAKKGKGPLAVKKEASSDDDFKMTESDFDQAEKELGGMRLSKFVKEHDVDEKRPVSIHATHVQKHYGKIHTHEYSPTTGDSIADAMRGFGGGKLENLLRDERTRGRTYIITKVDTGESAQDEIDKKDSMSASMSKWYGDIDKGKTNYRGD